jgi:hypothetical protein
MKVNNFRSVTGWFVFCLSLTIFGLIEANVASAVNVIAAVIVSAVLAGLSKWWPK